jgi:hypothetical protein
MAEENNKGVASNYSVIIFFVSFSCFQQAGFLERWLSMKIRKLEIHATILVI